MSLAKLGCLLLLTTLTNAGPSSRILNGDNAVLGQFPWMVSLRWSASSSHTCGGNLVTRQHVVTAAHCVDTSTLTNMFVVTGSISNVQGGEAHALADIRIHAGYIGRPNFWQNDIAVLKLASPVTLTAVRQLLPLPTRNTVNGDDCVISGWGRTYFPSVGLPAFQQTFRLKDVGLAECRAIWGDDVIADNHLCGFAGRGQGVCSGDSGSPLVCNGEHAGIASWVSPCANGVPDVYVRVHFYLDWIRERIADVDSS